MPMRYPITVRYPRNRTLRVIRSAGSGYPIRELGVSDSTQLFSWVDPGNCRITQAACKQLQTQLNSKHEGVRLLAL